MSILAWPDSLRDDGILVATHNNWPNTPMPRGGLSKLQSVFWHHDASPKGYSPGALNWMIGAYNAGQPSAQIWVDYFGVWHFVGCGYASHAGVVRGSLTSANSVGVETDHTINEPMSAALLESCQRGFASVCKAENRNSDFVTFHKIEAWRIGRKTDPYFTGTDYDDISLWEGQLQDQRRIIQGHIDGTIVVPTPEDIMSSDEYNQVMTALGKLNTTVEDIRNNVNVIGARTVQHIPLLDDAEPVLARGTFGRVRDSQTTVNTIGRRTRENIPMLNGAEKIEPNGTLGLVRALYKDADIESDPTPPKA